MLKKNKSKMILTSIIILLPVLAGLFLWNQLPDPMPTHWNMHGEADGWSSKPFAVIGLPVFMLAIHWLCMFITSVDPKNKNINGKPLTLVMWICPLISVISCTMMLAAAMGKQISIEIFMPLLLGAMFIIIGNYMPKCQQNYTIGIKVPWALNDQDNWNATHRFAGPVWVAGGFAIMISALFSLPWLTMVIVFAIAFTPVIYSYLYYRKHS